MNKLKYGFLLLFVSGLLLAQTLTPSENYIYERQYLEPVTTETPTARQVQKVNYYDGLGRGKQQISIKATPTGKDLVTPIEYDPFGRQVKDWLPLPQSSTTNGSYYTLPSTSVATSVYGDPLLYAEKELENSPLDRVLQQAAPGTPWSLASGKTQKLGYQVNLSSDNVKRYVTTTTWSGNATLSTLKIFTTTASENSTYYPASSLYKNKVTDENGNISYEFKNGQGQTLLLRKMEGTTPVDTYYVYNEYDQLAFVLAPLASDATKALGSGASVSASTLDELCYQYRYDGRSRIVEKKLPGKGWEYIVYDNQDRVVMTQDAQMRPTNQWLFTKYDRFSRVVYTGITSAGTRAVEQSTLNSKTANHETRASTPFTNSGSSVYYTNTAYPVATASSKVMTVQYYDTYPPESPSKPAVIVSSSQPTLNPTATSYTVNGYTSSRSTKGLPTAHYIKNTEDNGWTKNYTWYDTKGRALSTHSYNPLGGYTKTDNLLDFSGVPTYSYTYHKRLNADPQITVRNRFLYDAQNRLTHHYHQINSLPEELLAAHSYSEVGAILTKKVGTGTLQEINYTYNVRGWMTGINNTLSLGTDLFALTLRYHNPQSHPYALAQYNGNIAQIDWITKNGTSPELRRYSYNYDGLDRLLKAYYSKPSAQTTNTNAYNEYLTYDQNGNIKSLSRYGSVDGSVALIIDQLQYSYTGNRLIKVLDNSGNTLQGYPQGGSTITYDSNGNMTQHMDKGISLIEYNYLNLPKSITQAVGNTTYNYRADGIKLRKTYSTKTTDYLDGFQYETLGASTNLQFLTTAEGYYDMAKNAYIYNYLDHLGNVRLSYRKNSSGVLEIVEENNYYPFGLKHEGYNNLSTATLSYKYKYNGKELQETGMYDYGARFYMPDIGRWGVVDPLAEKMPSWSPYVYTFDNPVRFIDPDGRKPDDIIFGKSLSKATKDKMISDWKALTGLNLSYDESGRVSYTKSASYSGGSETARGMLMGAIDNRRTEYQFGSDNSRGSQIKELQGRGEMIDGKAGYTQVFDVNMNTDQIDGFISGTSESLNPLTNGYGMVGFHEVSHKYNNLIDGIIADDGTTVSAASIYGVPGDNVNFMNKIRSELDSSKEFTLPFGERKSYSPKTSGNIHFSPYSNDSYNKGLNGVDPKKDLYIKTTK